MLGKLDLDATTTEVLNEPLLTERNAQKPNQNLKNAICTIVCGVALPCIPVIVISSVLLYIIFKHRIVPQPGWPELYTNTTQQESDNVTSWISQLGREGGKAAYYVAYNPSTITTISAWTGRVIPYLSSSIMALVAFFAARHMVHKSKYGSSSDLPTSEQLTILIDLLDGSGVGPLKDTLLYRYRRKEKLVSPVPAAFTALALITLLGILISVIDTWFGVSVKPVVITQLSNNTAPTNSYGRVLSKKLCPNGPASVDPVRQILLGCNMEFGIGNFPLMTEADETSKVLAGVSRTNIILNFTSGSSEILYFLADARTDGTLDFKARSLAVSTQCTPMTTRCLQSEYGLIEYLDGNFSCTPKFNGNLTMQSAEDSGSDSLLNREASTGIGFSQDAKFSYMVGAADPTSPFNEIILPRNPLHFAAWAYGFPSSSNYSVEPFDGEVLWYYVNGYAAWILNCSSTVYDIIYTWADGAILNYTLSPSTPEMAAMMSGPFSQSIAMSSIAETMIANAVSFASSTHQLSTGYANGFSSAALAMAAGVMISVPNIIEQNRDSTVDVARVPLQPLYLLLSLKALYVLAVIILAIGAYCFTHPAETHVVKAQLSVKGLVEAHFDQPALQANVVKEVQSRLEESKKEKSSEPSSPTDDTPQESRKVGIMADAEGNWKYVTLINGVWQKIEPLVQAMVLPDARTAVLDQAGEIYDAWKG